MPGKKNSAASVNAPGQKKKGKNNFCPPAAAQPNPLSPDPCPPLEITDKEKAGVGAKPKKKVIKMRSCDNDPCEQPKTR